MFSTPGLKHRAVLAVALCLSNLQALQAAEPTVRAVDLRGLQIGAATTLTLDGDDLTGARLLLPFVAKQELKPGSTDKKAVIDVTLDGTIPPGYYQYWVVTDQGVSAPQLIGVDRLPQKVLAATVDTLPIALHGSVGGSGTVEVKFQGKAKQRIIIDAEAQRLGSKLRPIVHLLSPKKLQLAWAWGTHVLHNDCRIETVLPEDGQYAVTLHDAEYAAPAPGFFRLKIGDISCVDQVFPPVVGRGQAQTVELLGPAVVQKLTLPAEKNLGVLQLPWPLPSPKDGLWCGPRPFVVVGPRTEFVRDPNNKLPELPAGPVAVSGRILTAFEEDRCKLAVVPGKKVKLEVFAERIGSPLDAALVVRNEKGDVLARVEDSPGTLDPVLEYAVPDKVTAIIVGVVDSQGRAGPRATYRLVVDPLPAATADNWKLTTTSPRVSLPVGGRVVLPVFLERRGFAGKVDLAASLPGGVRAEGTLIPEGAEGTLVSLERGDAPITAAVIRFSGKGGDGSERPVSLKQHPMERLQPWLATEIALASANVKAGDFVVDWREFPAGSGLVPGTKLVLPVKMARTKDKTTVRLTLLTSQATPLLNNQPDPNKALRQQTPVEVPINVPNGDVPVLVPPDLTSPVYDVTVQADLLAADKKVLATSYAPVRRMPVLAALLVQLAGPERVNVTLEAKKATTVKVAGKIVRHDLLKGDVVLTLTGMPPGVTAAPVTIKAGTADFTLAVVLPATLPAGEVKGLKLSASMPADPSQPNLRVRGKEVELTFVVTAAAK